MINSPWDLSDLDFVSSKSPIQMGWPIIRPNQTPELQRELALFLCSISSESQVSFDLHLSASQLFQDAWPCMAKMATTVSRAFNIHPAGNPFISRCL